MLVPDKTGASFTAVTATVLVIALLASVLSFTAKLIVRVPAVGFSEMFAYVTERSAVWNSAKVAVLPTDDKVNTPALKLAVILPMPADADSARTSWPATKLVMVTVALANELLSTSLTTKFGLMIEATAFST